jgi:hypothetical protein
MTLFCYDWKEENRWLYIGLGVGLCQAYIMVLVPSKTFSITVRAPDLVLEALKSLYN